MKRHEINTFNTTLKRERQKRGWSQQHIAELVGIDINTVSRWERGVSFPTRSIQPKLCALFDMTIQELGLFSDIASEDKVEAGATPLDVTVNVAMLLSPAAISTDRTTSSTSPSLPTTPILPITAPSAEPRNPYKGLRAFRQEDAHDFFGRNQLIQEMVSYLRHCLAKAEEQADTARFLAVIGPSGCGKSSVVQAGVLQHLQVGVITDSEEWVYLAPITPGKYPITALATALARYTTDVSMTALRDELNKPTARGLHTVAQQIVTQPSTKVVLVIDQFEELFTQTEDEAERQQFIDLLLTACTEPGGAVIVLLTLRADFYDRPMAYLRLGHLIEQQHAAVFPLSVSELLDIIEQPAALDDVQVTFEESLVRDMLMEMQGQHNALPLLQFTLDQLFQRRAGHLLTRRAYEEIDGIRGALSRQAEQTYASLPSTVHRDLARVLFLRLVDLSVTEREATRLRPPLAIFTFADVAQTQRMHAVIAAFTEARLLATDQDDGNSSSVEISHETLLRVWPRYVEWQRKFRWDAHLQQNIGRDAATWVKHGKRRDRLYRGTQLAEARAWARRNMPNEQEGYFLRASVDRGRRVRILGTLSVLLIVVALLPFVANLFGIRTFFSNPIPPGGWWIMPVTNQHIHSNLLLEAYAYPGALTEPVIAYVDFTMRWYEPGTVWFTACHLTQHTSNNIFVCTVNLHSLRAPPGPVLISFNVYDTMGNVRDAPNGVHRIYYSP